MSKRLNPHRRLLAAQARVLTDAKLEQSRVNGADMVKLQQGRVRSHFESLDAKAVVHRNRDGTVVATFRAPKPASDDIPARKGKIVDGKFKPNRGQIGRFSTK